MSATDIADLPWPNIAAFLTSATLVLFTIGPKIPRLRDWLGEGVQRMVGVTKLTERQQEMHEQNAATAQRIEGGIALIERRITDHENNRDAHGLRR